MAAGSAIVRFFNHTKGKFMGVISGIITYPDGRPYSRARIRASVGGTFSGGVTPEVYSDDNGRFVLTWSSDGPAHVVYVNGQEVAKDVRNGSNTLHFHAK